MIDREAYIDLVDSGADDTKVCDWIDTQIAAAVSSAMVWQPMSQNPDECGWYLVWRENTQCQAEAYYDTDKGWMSAYSYTEGGCTKMYSDATHFMLIKPPEGL